MGWPLELGVFRFELDDRWTAGDAGVGFEGRGWIDTRGPHELMIGYHAFDGRPRKPLSELACDFARRSVQPSARIIGEPRIIQYDPLSIATLRTEFADASQILFELVSPSSSGFAWLELAFFRNVPSDPDNELSTISDEVLRTIEKPVR